MPAIQSIQVKNQYELTNNGKLRCKHCGDVFRDHVTSLKAHLSNVKFSLEKGVKLCRSVPPAVSIDYIALFTAAASKSDKKSVQTSLKRAAADHNILEVAKDLKQAKYEDCVSSATGMAADELMAKCWYKNAIPFHIADSQSFKAFMEAARNAPLSWKPPNRKRIAGDLLEKVNETMERVKRQARSDASAKGKRQTIISDGATIGKYF
jgi:hypothetical protein